MYNRRVSRTNSPIDTANRYSSRRTELTGHRLELGRSNIGEFSLATSFLVYRESELRINLSTSIDVKHQSQRRYVDGRSSLGRKRNKYCRIYWGCDIISLKLLTFVVPSGAWDDCRFPSDFDVDFHFDTATNLRSFRLVTNGFKN